MDICVIPPLKHLDLMNQGNRIFALAQLWKQDQNYREFIAAQKSLGKWIIMDNGAGDFDTTTTTEDLIQIVRQLMPSEIIPLDVLYNKEATIYNLERFIELLNAHNLLGQISIFAVPQGKTKQEWLECYNYMLNHPHVDVIGLSKITIPHIYKTGTHDTGIMEARHLLYHDLKQQNLLHKPLHCLGAGDPREFLKYINEPMYRSTDSCFTVWSAMNEIDWYKGNFNRIPTPKDYFEREITEDQQNIALSNIKFLKEVINVV